jgi:hypothetical protein
MFKYMSVEAAALFAKTLSVRFTQPSDLNDPFELRPLIDFEGTAKELRAAIDARLNQDFGTIDSALRIMERQQALDANFPKLPLSIAAIRTMIECNPALGRQFLAEIVQHKSQIIDEMNKAALWETAWEKFHAVLGQVFGIFSVSEDPIHPLMWSHYASQHYGVVVEFDSRHCWFDQRLSTSDEFRHLVRVAYVQNPQPRTWNQVSGADVLYTKSAAWSYEREWRVVRPLRDGTELQGGIFCFDVPPSAVRAVVFGCRTTAAIESHVRSSFSSQESLSHVRFCRAHLVPGGRIELTETTSA